MRHFFFASEAAAHGAEGSLLKPYSHGPDRNGRIGKLNRSVLVGEDDEEISRHVAWHAPFEGWCDPHKTGILIKSVNFAERDREPAEAIATPGNLTSTGVNALCILLTPIAAVECQQSRLFVLKKYNSPFSVTETHRT